MLGSKNEVSADEVITLRKVANGDLFGELNSTHMKKLRELKLIGSGISGVVEATDAGRRLLAKAKR